MSIEIVYLVPGQGAYAPGALADFASAVDCAEVLRTVDSVAAEHGRPAISSLLLEGNGLSGKELAERDPFALQLAIFAIGVAGVLRALPALRGGNRGDVAGVLMGHSMGEIAALTAAGAFSLRDGARLAALRALALEAECPRRGGMLSVQLSAARAAHLVSLVGDLDAAVAVHNAPGLSVISGCEETLAVVARIAEAMGVRATRLVAPYPFHSASLAMAAERFGQAIAGLAQRPLRCRVYSPVAGAFVRDLMDAKQLLVRQLTAPVDFVGAVRALHEEGARRFVDVAASGLGLLVKRTVPEVTTEMVAAIEMAAEGPATERPAIARPEPVFAEAVIAKPVTPAPVVFAAPAMPAPVGFAAPVAPAALADDGALIDSLSNVLEQLRELYAETLGYPAEAMTPEADLEADLGIDSLKRAEMLAKVTSHFHLEDLEEGQLASHQTLAELASLVAAAVRPAS